MAVSALRITFEHARQFREEGFFVLPASWPRAISTRCAASASASSTSATARWTASASTSSTSTPRQPILRPRIQQEPSSRALPVLDLMAQIAQAALGDTVHLFNEQYVVKGAEQGMKFGWHQDSGYIGYAHQPYLTCWIALDDMTEANGTVYLLPYARAGTRDVVKHVRDHESNDLAGYFGDDPGDPLIVPAAASPASRRRSSTAAAPTRPTACDASTSRDTRPSRSSARIAPRPRMLAQPFLVDVKRTS
jgi:Phytanoyl-CoA dioxygenase (PhyH)